MSSRASDNRSCGDARSCLIAVAVSIATSNVSIATSNVLGVGARGWGDEERLSGARAVGK